MTLAPTARTQAKRTNEAAAPRGESEDIIDRFIAHVKSEIPDAEADILKDLEGTLRAEFQGTRPYIRSTTADAKKQRLDKFRSIFNGTNPAEAARKLGIGRATVYRLIKTQGKA